MSTLVLQDTVTDGEGGEKRTFEPLPAGMIAEAEVVSVEQREAPFLVDANDPSKGNVQQISFLFKIVDERPEHADYKNRTIFGNTPITFSNHPECKLRGWVEEILDAGLDQLAPGFQLNLDDLVGERVRVVVGHRKNGKDFVEGLLRVKRTGPATF
jgi:hypothetical protein